MNIYEGPNYIQNRIPALIISAWNCLYFMNAKELSNSHDNDSVHKKSSKQATTSISDREYV
jgi:hypothetical protein